MTCPFCNYHMDASTAIGGESKAVPAQGDISICLKCGAFNEFTADLSLIPAINLDNIEPAKLLVMRKAQYLIRHKLWKDKPS